MILTNMVLFLLRQLEIYQPTPSAASTNMTAPSDKRKAAVTSSE